MKLALQMGRNLRELLATTDGAELSEWLAYDRIEPLEDGYWQSAQVCATLARAMGGADARIADFLPDRRRPEATRQTPAQQRAIVAAAIGRAQARGGTPTPTPTPTPGNKAKRRG